MALNFRQAFLITTPPSQVVVAVTAHAVDEHQKECKESGFDHFLAKVQSAGRVPMYASGKLPLLTFEICLAAHEDAPFTLASRYKCARWPSSWRATPTARIGRARVGSIAQRLELAH